MADSNRGDASFLHESGDAKIHLQHLPGVNVVTGSDGAPVLALTKNGRDRLRNELDALDAG
jgi:hypothetical protein